MTDYYAMAGILKSTKSVIHSNVSAWNTVTLPVSATEEAKLAAVEDSLSKLEMQLKKKQTQLDHLKNAERTEPESLPGVVIDDEDAKITGLWTKSTAIKNYVGSGYLHDDNRRNEPRTIAFLPELKPGEYEVRVAYTASSNRSRRVPILVRHEGGETTVFVDQTKKASQAPFESVGVFQFSASPDQGVIIENTNAENGVVIADAAQFLSSSALKQGVPNTKPSTPDDELRQLTNDVK